MKVNTWIEMWYKVYKEPNLKYNSIESIKTLLRIYILPTLGNMEITDVRGIHIQSLLNDIREKQNTMTKVKVLCGDIFKAAYNNQYIAFNPHLAVTIKNAKKQRRKAMTRTEQKYFEETLNNKHYELLFNTYLYTGARRNEVIKPGFNIDFENGLINIAGTKTLSSIRTVPLFPHLEDLLESCKRYKRYYQSYKSDYVTHLMTKHCRAIGLEGFCVHSLRNTFATRCLECGIGMATIQAWLGHSELATTMDIYVDKSIFSDKNNLLLKQEISKFNTK